MEREDLKWEKNENKLPRWKQQKRLCRENPAVLKSGLSNQ